MLERDDGFFDICDLKTAVLEKQRITKGRHRRRRFIERVGDGIAQLANYQDYFRFQKNREHAESKHNVQVKNPFLFLIVGNYENAPGEEIEEACRQLKPNYRILDYDTLNFLFLKNYLSQE